MLFFIVAQLYVLLSQAPVLLMWLRTPDSAYFPYYNIAQSLSDFYGYIAAIHAGSRGDWLYHNPYTSETVPSGILYLPYLLWGKITSLFGIADPSAYFMLHIVSIELFLFSLYFLMRCLEGKKHAQFAAIFSLIVTIPPPFFFHTPGAFDTFTPWWASMDAVTRLTNAPHHLIGQASLLLTISFFLLWKKKNRVWFLFLSCVFTCISGLSYSPVLLVILLPFCTIYAITAWRHRSKKEWIGITIIGVISVFLAGLIAIQTRSDYFQKVWVTWEIERWNLHQSDFNQNMVTTYIPLILLSLPGAYHLIKKKNPEGLFCISWALLPVILLPCSSMLHLSKIRIISISFFVPFGYLIWKSLSMSYKKYVLISMTGIIIFWISTTAYFQYHTIEQSRHISLYWNIFIPKDFQEVLVFLDNNAKPHSVILSNDDAGGIIPAFTYLRSYFGHINLTLNHAEKQSNTFHFYHQDWETDTAREFVQKNHIKYIFVGESEKLMMDQSFRYPFLKELFSISEYRVYEVHTERL